MPGGPSQQQRCTSAKSIAQFEVDIKAGMYTHRLSTASECSSWQCCPGAALLLRTLSACALLSSADSCAWQAVQWIAAVRLSVRPAVLRVLDLECVYCDMLQVSELR